VRQCIRAGIGVRRAALIRAVRELLNSLGERPIRRELLAADYDVFAVATSINGFGFVNLRALNHISAG